MAIRRFSVRQMLALAAIAPVLAFSACTQQPVKQVPVAASPAVSRPPAPSVPPPVAKPVRAPTGWNDAPQSPGVWTWSMEGVRSVARFGGDALVLSCNRDAAAITLIRAGAGQGQVPMTVVTSSVTRPLGGSAIPGPPATIAVTLAARDSLLDAMAFSRGRFVIETAGLPTLYVPSWPEVSKVVEDCR